MVELDQKGKQDKKFPAYIRHFIKRLNQDPRAAFSAIGRSMEEDGVVGYSAVPKLKLDVEPFKSLIRLRVELQSTKHSEVTETATCFVIVILEDNSQTGIDAFTKQIVREEGVIEYDIVKGGGYDALVRIVNSERGHDIKDNIGRLNNVAKANFSDVSILQSGVVDKYTADDFWNIKPDNEK